MKSEEEKNLLRESGEVLPLNDWEAFVLNHRKTGNHLFHLVSSICFFFSPAIALWSSNPYWMVLFFISGLIGTAGHYIFDDGRVSVVDATVRKNVPFYVLRMFFEIATGRYSESIACASRRYSEMHSDRVTS